MRRGSQMFPGLYRILHGFWYNGVLGLGFRAGLLAGLGAKDGGRGGRSMVYGLRVSGTRALRVAQGFGFSN